ncbi:minor tail protein [Gordonia phage Secretariat]|uniref:Minor tail protein n=1 Tax=Gordonia phage Secretariat TaxID=2725616 RepID=A0A6M3SVM7_9CAUD|nr:minor tail protein [Gordonia phage Secretariat]QJD49609.1 minor tail protein [Gordonia phage Secretariat]
MKFDQIILKGSKQIVLFDLNNPRSTPYTAKTIDGLDPTEVDVTLAQTSGGSGIYIGRREQLREITLNIYLNPDYSIGQTPDMLREELYLLNPINEDQSLDYCLMLDNVEVAMTPVYIKRTEAPAFSKETLIQVVLASTSGVFKRRTPITLTNPDFDNVFPPLPNEGSAPSGFRFEIDILTTINRFGIFAGIPPQSLLLEKLETDPNLLIEGDRLTVDTNIGQRGIWRTRDGVRESLIGNLTQESAWLTLLPGTHQSPVILDTGLDHYTAYSWVSYSHTPKYRGV